MIELGDPEFIADLRQLSEGQLNKKFDTLWNYTQRYLGSTMNKTVLAVDERRYNTIQYLVQAISICELCQQVTNLCPLDTEIPSEQWIRLQFWPQNLTHLSSLSILGD